LPDATVNTQSMGVASSSHAQPLERYDTSLLGNERLIFRLPAVDASVGEARRRVRAQLTEWRSPVELTDNAQLIVSELVTNALRHTGSRSVGCEVRILGSLLRIAVSSAGAGPAGMPTAAAMEDEGGRGLLLVCTLAEVWGVRPRDAGGGHVVWADLAIGPAAR
jgi:anti-sigma regulatory factor (Ser/Thr protein kinase)